MNRLIIYGKDTMIAYITTSVSIIKMEIKVPNIARLTEAFKILDPDNQQEIFVEVAEQALKQLGYSFSHPFFEFVVKWVAASSDISTDKRLLHPHDFVRVAYVLENHRAESRNKALFFIFDRDLGGTIDYDEFVTCATALKLPLSAARIRVIIDSHRGDLTYQDYLEVIGRFLKRKQGDSANQVRSSSDVDETFRGDGSL